MNGGNGDLKGYSDAMDALANAAPDEIKSDFKTFAEALKDFAGAMSDAGLKPGETPTAAQIAKLYGRQPEAVDAQGPGGDTAPGGLGAEELRMSSTSP